jgi:8-oxo-dGTP diphosphatase
LNKILDASKEIIMTREYPNRPIIGVGAIIFSNNRVLLARRGKNPGKGEWSLPGGAAEVGETLAHAVVREVQEETGLTVRPTEMVKTLERIFYDNQGRVRYHYVLCDFLCEIVSGQIIPASDVDEVEFVLLDELSVYKVAALTQEVIREALNPGSHPVYTIARQKAHESVEIKT